MDLKWFGNYLVKSNEHQEFFVEDFCSLSSSALR